MRHPDVLKFMDAVETDTTIYIMTERVRPLAAELQSMSGKTVQDKQDWLLWGLHRVTVRFIYCVLPLCVLRAMRTARCPEKPFMADPCSPFHDAQALRLRVYLVAHQLF